MSVEYWILGVVILLMGGFSDWRARWLRRRIETLEEIDVQESIREIILKLLRGKDLKRTVSGMDFRTTVQKVFTAKLTKEIHDVIHFIIRENIMSMNEKYEAMLRSKERDYLSSLPKEIQESINSVTTAKCDYNSLRIRLNSTEFLLELISKINEYQITGYIRKEEE